MKIRQSFITNSSSSSFIIAIKGGLDNLDQLIDVANPVWKSFIIQSVIGAMESEGDYGSETGPAECIFKNPQELKKYLEEDGQYNDKYAKKQYTELVNDGYVVYRKSVGYHDPITNKQLRSICDGKNFILVEQND
jgi:hypothetical protein